MQRVFDLANWITCGDALSEEDKKEYEWNQMSESWVGYKPPKGWSEVGYFRWMTLSVARERRLRQHRSI